MSQLYLNARQIFVNVSLFGGLYAYHYGHQAFGSCVDGSWYDQADECDVQTLTSWWW